MEQPESKTPLSSLTPSPNTPSLRATPFSKGNGRGIKGEGWYQKKWVKTAGLVIVTITILYAMVYVDVVLRAKEAYAEGEKYWRWHENPELKKAELDKKFEKGKAELDKKLTKNKITKDEYDRQLEILEFDRNFQMKESAIKYAYVWYKTAYELFSPPESKWVKLSREKAPLAKEKWKEELRAKKIPFEEYMLD